MNCGAADWWVLEKGLQTTSLHWPGEVDMRLRALKLITGVLVYIAQRFTLEVDAPRRWKGLD